MKNTFLKTSYVIHVLDEVARAFSLNEEAFNDLRISAPNELSEAAIANLFQFQLEDFSPEEQVVIKELINVLLLRLANVYPFDNRHQRGDEFGLNDLKACDEYLLLNSE